MVPFFQNDDFIGRESMFQQLEELLRPTSDRQLRAALWGLGGIGWVNLNILLGNIDNMQQNINRCWILLSKKEGTPAHPHFLDTRQLRSSFQS